MEISSSIQDKDKNSKEKNKRRIKEAERILFCYKNIKFQVTNYDFLQKIRSFAEFNNKPDAMVELRNNIEVIELALNALDEELRDLLIDYYINNKKIVNFYYSQATFYNKKREALLKLADLLGIY